MTRCVSLILPFPPSTNNLFLNGRNKARIKTPRYREWEARALASLRQQLPTITTIDGPYNLMLRFNMPRRGRIDVANFEKATSDLLVTAGVVSDDCNARIINLHKLPEIIKGGAVEVIVSEAA